MLEHNNNSFSDQLNYISALQDDLFQLNGNNSSSHTDYYLNNLPPSTTTTTLSRNRQSSSQVNTSSINRELLLPPPIPLSTNFHYTLNPSSIPTRNNNSILILPTPNTNTNTTNSTIFNYSLPSLLPTQIESMRSTPILTPPPTIQLPPLISQHRVYILNCNHCNTFLTDRGMRAVLLLKPHIILFSTDVKPCNAGPLNSDNRISTITTTTTRHEKVEVEDLKTCKCLTSSIFCYACGNVVGYHIVQPCTRCFDAVKKRSTNHHRYVFHQNEVKVRERKFYPGELGVKNFIPISTPTKEGGIGITRSYSNSSSSSDGISPTNTTSMEYSTLHSNSSSMAEDQKLDSISDLIQNDSSSSTTQRIHSTSNQYNNSSLNRVLISPSPAFKGMKAGEIVYWHLLVGGGGDKDVMLVDPDSRPRLLIERPAR